LAFLGRFFAYWIALSTLYDEQTNSVEFRGGPEKLVGSLKRQTQRGFARISRELIRKPILCAHVGDGGDGENWIMLPTISPVGL
jgi:hypothetical protein